MIKENVLNMLMFILYVCVSIVFLIYGVSDKSIISIIKLVYSLIWMFGGGIWFSKWLYEHVVGSM